MCDLASACTCVWVGPLFCTFAYQTDSLPVLFRHYTRWYRKPLSLAPVTQSVISQSAEWHFLMCVEEGVILWCDWGFVLCMGATWRIRMNDLCWTVMPPVTAITLSTCLEWLSRPIHTISKSKQHVESKTVITVLARSRKKNLTCSVFRTSRMTRQTWLLST